MEKYPENMMKAMGYFEIFYIQQLDDKKRSIKKFKEEYPNISGVYDWEYIDDPPNDTDPSEWALLMKQWIWLATPMPMV